MPQETHPTHFSIGIGDFCGEKTNLYASQEQKGKNLVIQVSRTIVKEEVLAVRKAWRRDEMR